MFNGKCIDLLGRRVNSQSLSQGIYILNGKKVVVQ